MCVHGVNLRVRYGLRIPTALEGSADEYSQVEQVDIQSTPFCADSRLSGFLSTSPSLSLSLSPYLSVANAVPVGTGKAAMDESGHGG